MTACLAPIVAMASGATNAVPLLDVVVPLCALAVVSAAAAAAAAAAAVKGPLIACGGRGVAIIGALGGGFIISVALVVRSVLAGVIINTSSILSDFLLILIAIPIGLLQSVPELAVVRARRFGAKSHDDTDRLIMGAGLWTMMWSLIITFVLNVMDLNRESAFFMSVEGVEMIVLNIGAAIAAFGFGRSFLRRQWVERAKRGEIEGVRVRVLTEDEARRPPQVLPMVRVAAGEELAVIEVVTRPAQGAYRNAEYVHPIALGGAAGCVN